MASKICFARITKGDLYEHLKEIDIFGRLTEDGEFVVYGCKNEDQPRFYQGILDYDKETDIQGFETVEQVKEWWEEEADMLLHISKGDFEIVEVDLDAKANS